MAHQQQPIPPRGVVPPGTPAWQSLPTAIRVAVWMWAVITIASVIGSALAAVIFLFAMMAALS